MPGILAPEETAGLTEKSCMADLPNQGDMIYPFCSSYKKSRSELLLLRNLYNEKLCLSHPALCCYAMEKRTVLEVKGHIWEVIKLVAGYVSGSSNFAAHYKLKQCSLKLSWQDWPRHTLSSESIITWLPFLQGKIEQMNLKDAFHLLLCL